MNAPLRPAAPDTDWLVEQLQTSSASELQRIADAAFTWAALVNATFEARYPLEHAIWCATIAADFLAIAEARQKPS